MSLDLGKVLSGAELAEEEKKKINVGWKRQKPSPEQLGYARDLAKKMSIEQEFAQWLQEAEPNKGTLSDAIKSLNKRLSDLRTRV